VRIVKGTTGNPSETAVDAACIDAAWKSLELEADAIRGLVEDDENLSPEERLVRLWRFDQLAEHGYPKLDALRIACDVRIDLQLARRLVSVLGCPAALAVTILT
jgi:hypothetical protein